MKCASFTRCALDPDLPLHRCHQTRRNGQTQTGAAKLAGGPTVGLRKWLEDHFLFFLLDANARVSNRKMQQGRTAAWRLHGDFQFHLAVLSELNRIPQKIYQHLPEPGNVSDEPLRYFRLNIANQLQALLVRWQRQGTRRLFDQSAHVEGDRIQFQLA